MPSTVAVSDYDGRMIQTGCRLRLLQRAAGGGSPAPVRAPPTARPDPSPAPPGVGGRLPAAVAVAEVPAPGVGVPDQASPPRADSGSPPETPPAGAEPSDGALSEGRAAELAAAGIAPPERDPPAPDSLRAGLAGLTKRALDSWPGPKGSFADLRVVEPHSSWGGADGPLRNPPQSLRKPPPKRPATAPMGGRRSRPAVPLEHLLRPEGVRAPPVAAVSERTEAGSPSAAAQRTPPAPAPEDGSAAAAARAAVLAGELASLLQQLPDLTTGACAALDCAAELPVLHSALPPGWRALLRRIRDALMPAVLADPICPAPPLTPGPRHRADNFGRAWWTSSQKKLPAAAAAATLDWVRRRSETLQGCTTWRAVCELSHKRDELLSMTSPRSRGGRGGGLLPHRQQGQQQLVESTNAHWETVLTGIVLRVWRGYTRTAGQRRAVLSAAASQRGRKLILMTSLCDWKAFAADSKRLRGEDKLRHSSTLLTGLRERFDTLRKRYEEVEYTNRDLRAQRDELLAQTNELKKQLADRRENPFFFDLAHPLVDPSGYEIPRGYIGFARPDMSQHVQGMRVDGDGGGAEPDAEPAFYDVWVEKGTPQLKQPWVPEQVLLQWANHELERVVRPKDPLPPTLEVLLPFSLRRLRDARRAHAAGAPGSKMPISFAGPPGRVDLLAGLGRDQLTQDHWITLFAAVQPRALAYVAGEMKCIINAPQGATREERGMLIWRTAWLLGLTGDIDQALLGRGELRQTVLLLTKLFCYSVASQHLSPEDSQARDALSHTPLWGSPPDPAPPASLRMLLAPDDTPPYMAVPAFSVGAGAGALGGAAGDEHSAVLLWASSELQAAQSGVGLSYVGPGGLSNSGSMESPTLGARSHRPSSEQQQPRASTLPKSPAMLNITAPKPAAGRKGAGKGFGREAACSPADAGGPDPALVWWAGGDAGWAGVEPSYRVTLSPECDADATRRELQKLGALAAQVTRHRGDVGTRAPGWTPVDERSEKQWREQMTRYLLRALATVGGGAPPPVPPAALAAGSADARMIYLCALYTAVWQRQKAESGKGSDEFPLDSDSGKRKGDRKKRKGGRSRDRKKDKDQGPQPVQHKVTISASPPAATDVLTALVRADILAAVAQVARGKKVQIAVAAVAQQLQHAHDGAPVTPSLDQSVGQAAEQVTPAEVDTARALVIAFGGNIMQVWQGYLGAGGVPKAGALRLMRDVGILHDCGPYAPQLAAQRRTQALAAAADVLKGAELPRITPGEIGDVFHQAWILGSPETRAGPATLGLPQQQGGGSAVLSPSELVTFFFLLAGKLTAANRDLTVPDRFKDLMLRTVLPAVHHAESPVFLAPLYTERSQAALRSLSAALGAAFVAYSSCPTHTRLLDDRRMSDGQLQRLLIAAGVVPKVFPEPYVTGAFICVALAADDGRRCVEPDIAAALDELALTADSDRMEQSLRSPVDFGLGGRQLSSVSVSPPGRPGKQPSGRRPSSVAGGPRRSRVSIAPGVPRRGDTSAGADLLADAAAAGLLVTISYTQFVEALFLLAQQAVPDGLLPPEVRMETFLTHILLPRCAAKQGDGPSDGIGAPRQKLSMHSRKSNSPLPTSGGAAGLAG
eukprot:TRINITY_DN9581_c0_g1_i1.p1 TRINITY_DN9581_c0_g1~~TRINITY_DN9581_c0_g1_i1.p1  ORF type:complete len:1631 (+),score=483.37 TRINITY_DN9581_c0_g1_i1:84-4895(+)